MSDNLILVLLFLCASASVNATTDYIDYVNGFDSNSGTATNAAWQHDPYMQGFTGSYVHVAGDRHIFKGGITWPSSCFHMYIPTSGNSSALDYYGVDKTWYSGSSWTKPKFDLQYAADTGIALTGSNSYMFFDSLEICHLQSPAQVGPALFSCSFCQYITMTNCYLHGWLLTGNGPGIDGQHGGYFCSHSIGGNIGNLLLGTEIENSENGLAGNWNGVCVFQGDVISNCLIHDNGSLIDQAQTVEYSRVYNQGYPYTNYDNQFHLDMLWLSDTTGANPPANCYCHHNYIYNGGFGSGAGLIFSVVPTATNYIYDNVFFGAINTYPLFSDPSDSYESLTGTVAGTIYCYNNTCVNTNTAFNVFWHITQRFNVNNQPVQLTSLFLTNNLFGGPVGAFLTDSGLTTGNSTWCANYQNGNNLCLGTNLYMSKGLMSNSPVLIYNPTSATSPAVGVGANLSSLELLGFANDIIGVQWPQVGAWDIGAYKYNMISSNTIVKNSSGIKIQYNHSGVTIKHP